MHSKAIGEISWYAFCMEKLLNIQEMSKLIGLSTHTLRYYEKMGMLKGVARNDQGYRCYSEVDLLWIQFLICLREMDMPISEMMHYSNLRSQGDSTVYERRVMLEAHQDKVVQQMDKLNENLGKIGAKIEHYKGLEKAVFSEK